jgi:hypothetical protein
MNAATWVAAVASRATDTSSPGPPWPRNTPSPSSATSTSCWLDAGISSNSPICHYGGAAVAGHDRRQRDGRVQLISHCRAAHDRVGLRAHRGPLRRPPDGWHEQRPLRRAEVGLDRARQVARLGGPANGVTVNAVVPSSVNTALLHNKVKCRSCARTWTIPTPRGRAEFARGPGLLEPEDVSSALMFLIWDRRGYLNGEVLTLSGGMSASLP